MANPSKLIARFVLDENGNPKIIKKNERKHYWIDLQVLDAPNDTYAVNYELDDSYYEPLRESRDSLNGFVERLTSYGDYTVQAKLRTKNRIEAVATDLSEALTRGHIGNMSPVIEKALDDIKKY